MQNKYHLLIGSNKGDRAFYLLQACMHLLKTGVHLNKLSSIYESEPWGMEQSTPWFYNMVLEVETELNEFELLDSIQTIEKDLGRLKKSEDGQYFDRTIDIDILLKGKDIVHKERLKIPHKELENRMFALLPLFELVGNIPLPGKNLKLSDVIHHCKDLKTVNKLSSLAQ